MNDFSIETYEAALAADRHLNTVGHDLTANDHHECDAAIEAAYTTKPTSCVGIAALAALAIEVEAPDPHMLAVLTTIRDAATCLASA